MDIFLTCVGDEFGAEEIAPHQYLQRRRLLKSISPHRRAEIISARGPKDAATGLT